MVAKSLLRTCVVALSCVVALLVYNRLDSFLSVTGALTCIPIAFLIPAGLHYEVIAKPKGDKRAKIIDLAILIVTSILLVYCTTVSIITFDE